MLYKTIAFYKGDIRARDKVEALSPLQAAKNSKKPVTWSHIMVIGRKVYRFAGKKYVKVDSIPTLSTATWKGRVPSVLAMYGNVPEFYKFEHSEERDKIYGEMKKCITSMSAGSAKAGVVLTSIIASLDEIKGTKSFSTSRKTSNGYATSATWTAGPTRENIAKSSGKGKSEGTGLNIWSDGLKVFPSKQDQTFLAKIQKLETTWRFPGTNTEMQAMAGKTVELKYYDTHKGMKIYKGAKWYWLEKWIDPTNITAKVKEEIEHHRRVYGKNGAPVHFDQQYAGRTIDLKLCTCGCGAYIHKNSYFMPDWLEAPNE